MQEPSANHLSFKMVVDRPFFILIRVETTGTILFMGWVGDPECADMSSRFLASEHPQLPWIHRPEGNQQVPLPG
jgi:Serpin (serine protease inhibitor)